MARFISSLLKPLNLNFGVTLLSVFLLTGCAGRQSPENPTITLPPGELLAQTASPYPVTEPVEITLPASLTPEAKMVEEKPSCISDGDPGPLPEAPFDALPGVLLEFLNEDGSADGLADALYLAGVANLPEPVALGDITGDGVDEVVISIFDPNSTSQPPAGMLLIFACEDGDYRLAYQEDTRPSDGAPGIRFIRDLNADGRVELVTSSASCGAHTCYEKVQVIQWDGSQFGNYLEGDTDDLPYPTIYLSPTDEDGLYDLQVTGSGIGSVGAGPQRNISRTWSYTEDTQRWLVKDFHQEPSNYRIHVLHDAGAAAENGDYQEALMLYNRVISDTTLEDWLDPQLEQSYIQAFARYQMAAIYTLQDRDTFARTVLNEMQNLYTSDGPLFVFFEMAAEYMEAYSEGGAERACEGVQIYASQHPGILDPLGPQNFGYGNPEYTFEDLCP